MKYVYDEDGVFITAKKNADFEVWKDMVDLTGHIITDKKAKFVIVSAVTGEVIKGDLYDWMMDNLSFNQNENRFEYVL